MFQLINQKLLTFLVIIILSSVCILILFPEVALLWTNNVSVDFTVDLIILTVIKVLDRTLFYYNIYRI